MTDTESLLIDLAVFLIVCELHQEVEVELVIYDL